MAKPDLKLLSRIKFDNIPNRAILHHEKIDSSVRDADAECVSAVFWICFSGLYKLFRFRNILPSHRNHNFFAQHFADSHDGVYKFFVR